MAFAAANNLEGGTNTTAISAANSGGASGDAFDAVSGTAPTFDNTHSHSGTYGVLFATAAASSVNWTSATIGSITTLRGRFYMYPTATGSGTLVIARALRSGTVVWKINYNAATKMALQINSAAGTVGTTVLGLNKWWRMEYEFVAAGVSSTSTLNIYDGDSTVITETITNSSGGAAADTTVDEMRYGPNVAYASSTWMDDMLVTDLDFPGPVQAGPSMALYNQIAVSRAATY